MNSISLLLFIEEAVTLAQFYFLLGFTLIRHSESPTKTGCSGNSMKSKTSKKSVIITEK